MDNSLIKTQPKNFENNSKLKKLIIINNVINKIFIIFNHQKPKNFQQSLAAAFKRFKFNFLSSQYLAS